ncbi:MAG: DUF6152 family protein [Pseudomonadota bacterium]|nr:DUF6152 family protein [Pseudomonadota bacterium]
MRGVVFSIGLLGLPALPASGHHSEAAFDTDTVVAFEGTVVEYGWRNPHVYIVVESNDSTSGPTQWQIETSSTPILMRGGWTQDSLHDGEKVAVRVHPERDTNRNYAILLTLERNDGTVMSAASADPRGVVSASSLSGVWKGSGGQTEAEFRLRLANPTLTEKGAAAKESYDFYTDNPVARCIAHTSPWLITTGLYLNEIELGDDIIVMRSEFFDVERTIFMDGREHPNNGERTSQGYSIGWWEDDTLVVDTRQFADHPTGNGPGVPSGAQKHVVERYTLSRDGSRIILDIFLEDPEYLAESLAGRVEWLYAPELQLYRYNCDPEVSRRGFSLD